MGNLTRSSIQVKILAARLFQQYCVWGVHGLGSSDHPRHCYDWPFPDPGYITLSPDFMRWEEGINNINSCSSIDHVEK
ncbi:hypothetical protein HZ326_11059 [Fusarium oxysporum f. sp. albedinis]|nr:hypothetical protein HZ326_11059 [Fusarium oxysporum f. sp. albedinis]